MDDRTRRLLEAPPTPLLVRLAAPNAAAFFIQSTVSLAEVWFIGRLGTEALAGIALVFPLLMLTQGMSGGAFGGAVSSAIARALGTGDRERADALLWHVVVIALLGAATFLTLFLLGGERFLAWLGGSGTVLDAASRYCLILFCGGPFLWLFGMTGAVYRGTGNMRFPASLQIVTALIQVPLSGVLILGAFGAPQLGITGAAISQVTAAAVTGTIMLVRLTGPKEAVRLARRHFRLQRALFADILRVAAPATLSPVLTTGLILALTALVGRFGEAALAGYGVGSRIEFLMIPLIFGLGAAMTAVVGTAVGAKHIERAEAVGYRGGAMAAGLAGVAGLLLAIFPDAWIPAFAQDPAAQETARQYIRIVGPCFAFQGLGLSLYFASQGAGRMLWPIAATLTRFVVAIGLALLLIGPFGSGVEGVFIAAAVAMVLFGSSIAIAIRSGAWR